MIRTLLVAAILLAAPAADAQTHQWIFDEIDHCPGENNVVLLQCAAGIGDREDARLNRAYKAAMARLPPPRRQALREAQRSWIKDRDALCQPAFDGGGAQAGTDGTICVAEVTRDRAVELERIVRNGQ